MEDTITDLDAEIAKFDVADDTETTQQETQNEQEPVKAVEAEPESEKEADTEPSAKDGDDEDTEARIRRLHIEAREAKRAAQQAQREADIAKGTIQLPRDEAVISEAQQLARQMAAQQVWDKECNRIGEAGAKEFKDFDKIVETYKTNFNGGVPTQLIEGAIEVMPGQEAKMLHYLGRNLDVAEQILSLSPVKAGAAIAKLAEKINAKPAVSKAPAPIKPVAGGNGTDPNSGRDGYYDGMSTAAFMKMEAKERRNRYH